MVKENTSGQSAPLQTIFDDVRVSLIREIDAAGVNIDANFNSLEDTSFNYVYVKKRAL